MTQDEKKSIMIAARTYMDEKNISQNALCARAGVNVGYMVNMMKGDFTFSSTKIKDIYFQKLAHAIGFTLKKEYWPMVETPQMRDIYAALLDAKEDSKTRMIIGETGCGKTYTLNRFAGDYPKGTYVVTCSRLDRQNDLIRKIQVAIEKDFRGTGSQRIDQISVELSRRYDNGVKPILIFDEAEYLTISGLLGVKTIYDYLKDMCGIVFIGTEDLLNNLEKTLHKTGMKQFFSRFKAGKRIVRAIDREDYSLFLDGHGFEKELVEDLQGQATNYRELADYLVPALKDADRMGVTLTSDLFRSMNYLHKK